MVRRITWKVSLGSFRSRASLCSVRLRKLSGSMKPPSALGKMNASGDESEDSCSRARGRQPVLSRENATKRFDIQPGATSIFAASVCGLLRRSTLVSSQRTRKNVRFRCPRCCSRLSRYKARQAGPNPNDLIFPTSQGRPDKKFENKLKRIVRRGNLNWLKP